MSEHRMKLEWKRGDTPFTYEQYVRGHTWRFESGITVEASAAPDYRGDPDRVDPEEAFVASLASCHMLTFLAVACKKKFTVEAYEDEPVGTLAKNDQGKLSITRVVLTPRVAFSPDNVPTEQELEDLHHRAHEMCFIANSVTTEIAVAGSMVASG